MSTKKNTGSNGRTKESKAKPAEMEAEVVYTGGNYFHSLFDPVSPYSLAAFRIMWGLVMLMESLSYVFPSMRKTSYLYLNPLFHAKYYGFEWVEPYASYEAFAIHFITLMVLSIMITIGLFYRFACLGFLFAFSYVYFLDMSYYLNHFYLLCTVQALLVISPGNAAIAVDNLIFPSTKRETIPRWYVSIFRGYMVIVYCYAGIVKMNPDWLRAEPIRHWLAKRFTMPVIGPIFLLSWIPYFFCYGGMVYDLVIGFILLSSNRFVFTMGVLMCTFFHFSNKVVFNIGIFPWMCLGAMTLFFEYDWPTRAGDFIHRSVREMEERAREIEERNNNNTSNNNNNDYRSKSSRKKQKKKAALALEEASDQQQQQQHGQQQKKRQVVKRVVHRPKLTWGQLFVIALMGTFLAHQIYFPMRNLWYPGDVTWTEYGHLFSWRMKLRNKSCELNMWIEASDPLRPYGPPKNYNQSYIDVWGYEGVITPEGRYYVPFSSHINEKQLVKMTSRPDIIHQFALYIADYEQMRTGSRPRVFANASCSLNYRSAGMVPYINHTIDLASETLWDWPYSYILPPPPISEKDAELYPWNWDWLGWLGLKEPTGPMPFPPVATVSHEEMRKKVEDDFRKWKYSPFNPHRGKDLPVRPTGGRPAFGRK